MQGLHVKSEPACSGSTVAVGAVPEVWYDPVLAPHVIALIYLQPHTHSYQLQPFTAFPQNIPVCPICLAA